VEKRLGDSPAATRNIATAGSIERSAAFFRVAACCDVFKRIFVVGNGKEPVKVCGAMSQQYGDGGRGNESAPQKFVHLVGYRDPKPRAEPWVRPSVSPVKR
jgi:hypothetical protein